MECQQMIITILCSVLASSGFWVYLQKNLEKKDVKTKMLIGLAHERIITLGMFYLERGDWITQEEYENLHDYLYKPYEDMGGNGAAKRIMTEIDKHLRICKSTFKTYRDWETDRKSTRLNSSHSAKSRMPSSA